MLRVIDRCPRSLAARAAEREMRAVDSEHAKNLQSEPWREEQLLRSMAVPQSP
jgi:secreted Zn-dependent insulinase-like peptidase